LHQAHYDYLIDRMDREGFRFKLSKLPHLKTAKEDRISFLTPEIEFGRILFPDKFGHGSHHDSRDTLDQFIQDEYRLWCYKQSESAARHDDGLDGLAWFVQPETKSMFPFPQVVSTTEQSVEHNKKFSSPNPWSGVSPHAF
jgi:hypothetical protein